MSNMLLKPIIVSIHSRIIIYWILILLSYKVITFGDIDKTVTVSFVDTTSTSLNSSNSVDSVVDNFNSSIKKSSSTSKDIAVVTVKIDINSASINELMKIKGIGEVIGGRIIDYRDKNGKFLKIDDIVSVKGIGDKTLQKIKPFIVAK